MHNQRLCYKYELGFNIYSITLWADDERVVNAVAEWIDQGIARYHESEKRDRHINLELHFFTNTVPPDRYRQIQEEPTATFEDVEFYSGNTNTVMVIDGQTIIDVKLGENNAVAYISEEHVESPWILAHRVFYLPILELLRNVDCYYVHAGSVCRDDRCVLLCGGSGQGKSTTTYALVKSGFSYMSDDAVFVRGSNGNLEIFSFPEKIKLDANSCSFFPELCDYRIPRGKVEIPVEDTGITNVCVTGKPHTLILVEIGKSKKGKMVALAKSKALLGLIRQSISLTSPDGIDRHLDVLKQLCESSHTFRLRLGKDVTEVPGLVEDVLRDK